MPFNGSGTFTLAEAAFVPNTVINSTTMNSDLSDIATGLTTAVTKDGQTTITAPFKGASGSVGLPMYSFSADTDSGMYRIGANNIGLSVGGVKILDIASTGLSVVGTLGASSDLTINTNKFVVTAASGNAAIAGTLGVVGLASFADGTVSLPGITFTSDPDSGVYIIGANNIGIAVNGAKEVDINSTRVAFSHAVTVASGFTVSAGAVSLPAGSVANSALAAPGAMVFLGTQTAANVATLDFTTGFSATYDDYVFECDNLLPATDDVELRIQVTTDGGSTWKTTAYLSGASGILSDGTAIVSSTVTAAVAIGSNTGGNSLGNDAGYGFSGMVKIYNVNSAAVRKGISFYGTYIIATGSAAAMCTESGGGFWNGGNTAINGVRFIMESGNIISGNIRMYGLTHA